MTTYRFDLSGDHGDDVPITIDGVPSTPGTWVNYDDTTDQVALPQLSRNYRFNDGPDSLILEDSLNRVGGELVADPNFEDAALTGWVSADGNSTLTHRSSDNTVLFENQAEWSYMRLPMNDLVEGEKYLVEFELVSSNLTGAMNLHVGIGVSGNNINLTTPLGTVRAILTATSEKSFQIRPASAGSFSVRLGSISVKPINTAAILNNTDSEDWT